MGAIKKGNREMAIKSKQDYCTEGFNAGWGHLHSLLRATGDQWRGLRRGTARSAVCFSETHLSDGGADSGAVICHIPVWPQANGGSPPSELLFPSL